VAIENSRLYSERAHIAKTLQDGLLPPTLEPPPGWEVAVLFRAAGSANEVGGDFYDVVRLDDGWISFIGDVTGKGAPAAAITARARYTMISVAQLTGDAGSALERVNLALTELGGLPFCTVACVQFRGAPDTLEIISAGHPLPYVLGSDGVAPVGRPGPLLGFDPDMSWSTQSVEIEPGESIVLYSDGVTDAVGKNRESFGEERLRRLLHDAREESAQDLIERLDRALLGFQGSEQRDDVAVPQRERDALEDLVLAQPLVDVLYDQPIHGGAPRGAARRRAPPRRGRRSPPRAPRPCRWRPWPTARR
jgi:serine phosphatase RsbU (regulator of sigma subunit)